MSIGRYVLSIFSLPPRSQTRDGLLYVIIVSDVFVNHRQFPFL